MNKFRGVGGRRAEGVAPTQAPTLPQDLGVSLSTTRHSSLSLSSIGCHRSGQLEDRHVYTGAQCFPSVHCNRLTRF